MLSASHLERRHYFNAIRDGTQRFDSAEDVLRCFLTALQPLISADLVALLLPTQAASSSSSSRSADTVPAVSLIEAVQEALLLRITIDWQEVLIHDDVFYQLLDACFFSVSDAAHAGLLQQCGLRVLSRILSSGTVHDSSTSVMEPNARQLHPLVCKPLLYLCDKSTSLLSVDSIVAALLEEPNKARRRISWTDTLRLLTSFPDRIANFTLGKAPPDLQKEHWFSKVVLRGLVDLLKTPTSEAHDEDKLELIAELVTRLDKLGYMSTLATPSTDAKLTFWHTFLRHSIGEAHIAKNWAKLASLVSDETRARINRSLVSSLDAAARQYCGSSVVTSNEKLRTGAEGTAFLSPTTHSFVVAAGAVLRKFLLVEDHEEVDEAYLEQALCPTPQAPVMAWVWGALLTQTRPESTVSMLDQALRSWADPSRLKRSTLEQEIYITTLIICLLASTPSATSEGGRTLVQVSSSSALLEGVSRHLEHPDTSIRRLGMLLAELISSRTATEPSKKLQFGRGIWDGSGEGREEARVLRALHDGWNYHRIAVGQLRDTMDDDLMCKTVGISEEESQVAQVVKPPRRIKRVSVVATTRKLPQSVAPPARGSATRPLITMIGSDDEEDAIEQPAAVPVTPLLRMFAPSAQASAVQIEETLSTDDEDGHSSDSTSNDQPGDRQDEMNKLAADLAGLDAAEASTLLGSKASAALNKPAKAKQRVAIDDFEADREAHAPTFGDKRARPPVYISQLAPLLKSNERASVKLGLKHAATLIRRKSVLVSGGRGEVVENAVDLGLSLVALHNNFSIGKFDERRLDALIALLVGSPKVTAAVLTEQVFGSQYSIAQRCCMLTVIAQGALELANGSSSGQHILEGKAKELGDAAATKAKQQGEDKVPAIRRERTLMMNDTRRRGPMIQQMPTQHAMSNSLTMNKYKEATWTETVGPSLIFPLINRFLAYYADFVATRRQSRGGRFVGAGMSALFGAQTIAALLDTLTILVDLAASTPAFTYEVTSLTLELISALLLNGDYAAATDADSVPVLASALNLFLVTLQHNLSAVENSVENAANFVQRHGEVLRPLLLVTRRIFEQTGQQASQSNQDKFRTRISSRAAALLLLASEMEDKHRAHVTSLLGFQF